MVEYDNSINNGFTKFPNKFIWNCDKPNETLLKTIDVMTLSILTYIDNNIARNSGISKIYIKEMIEFMGKKPKSGKDGINNKIKDILDKLNKQGYIEILKGDISVINKPIEIKLNILFEKNKEGKNSRYFDLKTEDYRKIFNIVDVDNITIFNTFCYILSRIRRRELKLDKNGNVLLSSKDINSFGGTAEIFFGKIEEFVKDLKISNKTVSSSIDILVENGLIFKGNIGRVRKGKEFRNAVNVYALNEDELREGLKQIKGTYEKDGYKVEKSKKEKEKEKEDLINFIGKFLFSLRVEKTYNKDIEAIWDFFIEAEDFSLKKCKNNYSKLLKAKKVIDNLNKKISA